jgi:hypothetical protein
MHLAPGNRVAEKERLPFWPFTEGLSGNLCAKILFCRSGIVPAVSLHCKKYFRLGHKHLAPGG